VGEFTITAPHQWCRLREKIPWNKYLGDFWAMQIRRYHRRCESPAFKKINSKPAADAKGYFPEDVCHGPIPIACFLLLISVYALEM
jgi:hypothetical protein